MAGPQCGFDAICGAISVTASWTTWSLACHHVGQMLQYNIISLLCWLSHAETEHRVMTVPECLLWILGASTHHLANKESAIFHYARDYRGLGEFSDLEWYLPDRH